MKNQWWISGSRDELVEQLSEIFVRHWAPWDSEGCRKRAAEIIDAKLAEEEAKRAGSAPLRSPLYILQG